MNKEEKDGESYLDELLNTVAPDWENDAENRVVKSEEDVTLDDALAVLNDLPGDTLSEQTEQPSDPDADMDELLGLLSDFDENDSSGEEEAAESEPEAEDISEVKNEDISEVKNEDEPEIAQEEMSGQEMAIEPEAEYEQEDDSLDDLEPEVSMNTADEDEMPVDDIFALNENSENEMSDDPIAVDDIFQDALSAVGYSEDGSEPGSDGEDTDSIFSLDEVADLLGETDENEEEHSEDNVDNTKKQSSKKKERKVKKDGFFKRVFGNVVNEETEKEEEKQRLAMEEEEEKKAADREEKKKQAQADKEEKAKLAEEAKENKKQKKLEQVEKKQQLKEEKKKRKEEAAAQAAKEVVGKLNPAGVTIVIIFFATIGIFIFLGMSFFGNKSISAAENYFANEQYVLAYDEVYDSDLKKDDKELYNKIRICSQLQKQMNSYSHYGKMNMKLEALDALVKGIQMYDSHKEQADSLGITSEINGLESQIAAGLYNDFGLSETQARDLIAIQDRTEYTNQLQEIVNRVAAVTQ